MNTWNDISTAPKNKTKILVGWWTESYHYMHQQRVHTGWYFSYAVAYWDRHYNPETTFNWCLTETGNYAIDSHMSGEPTHWQPLPTPPPEPTN